MALPLEYKFHCSRTLTVYNRALSWGARGHTNKPPDSNLPVQNRTPICHSHDPFSMILSLVNLFIIGRRYTA
jgi:hypothetical protein